MESIAPRASVRAATTAAQDFHPRPGSWLDFESEQAGLAPSLNSRFQIRESRPGALLDSKSEWADDDRLTFQAVALLAPVQLPHCEGLGNRRTTGLVELLTLALQEFGQPTHD